MKKLEVNPGCTDVAPRHFEDWAPKYCRWSGGDQFVEMVMVTEG
jgi:hypothetical protein